MADAADRKPINQVRFTGRDFNTIFDSLLRRAKVEFADDYNDFVSTSQGVMFMDLMAYGLAQLHWYLDRRASETFLDTARTRNAISRGARQIGYKMRPAAASSTDLTVVLDASTISGSGVLPEGFRFTGPNGLIFEATADVAISTSSSDTVTITVPVREGETRTTRFTSSGEANQRLELTGVDFEGGEYVADGLVEVVIDSVDWSESEFLTFDQTDQFEADYNGEPPFVRFGNGVAGNIPEEDADIAVTYVAMHGADGNVTANSITAAEDTLIILGDIVTINSVTNEEGSTGGVDPEDPERARVLAPLSFAARNVAITKEDYETAAQAFTDAQYGSVAMATASIVRETSLDSFISDSLEVVNDALSDYESDISSRLSDLSSDVESLQASLTAIASGRSTVEAEIASIQSQVTTGRSHLAQIDSGAADALSDLGQIDALLDSTTGIRSVMQDLVDGNINSEEAKAKVDNKVSSVESLLDDAETDMNSIRGTTSSASSAFGQIDDSADEQQTAMNSQEEEEDTSSTLADSIETDVEAVVDAFPGPEETVNDTITDLTEYLTGLFSDGCKANLVSVPVLTLNSAGFYAAPSAGLIDSLQDHLDGIKEVTHAVRVISGDAALVAADIDVEFTPTENAVSAKVKAAIESVVNAFLKDREFGEDVYLSDLYNAITTQVENLDWANVDITGPSSYLTDGNLVVGPSRVITKGTLTVSEAA